MRILQTCIVKMMGAAKSKREELTKQNDLFGKNVKKYRIPTELVHGGHGESSGTNKLLYRNAPAGNHRYKQHDLTLQHTHTFPKNIDMRDAPAVDATTDKTLSQPLHPALPSTPS